MIWWNSLEKAGNISKIALTAIKSAQQKIDEVLDITEETAIVNTPPTKLEYSVNPESETSVSVESCLLELGLTKSGYEVNDDCENVKTSYLSRTRSHDGFLADSNETVAYNQSDNVVPSDPDKLLVDTNTETDELSGTDSGLIKDDIPVSEHKIPQALCEQKCNIPDISTPKYVAEELIVDINSHFSSLGKGFHLVDKSVSNEDISSLHRTSSDVVLPFTAQPIYTEGDFDTNTTSSDIEVISCCNSTNGGEVHGLNSSIISNTISSAKKAGLEESTQQMYSLGEFSASVILSKFSNRPAHRRSVSVSQDLYMDSRNTVGDDLIFAYHDLAKEFFDVKHLLNVREAKIMQLSQENNALQNSIAALENQLKTTLTTKDASPIDIASVTSEFSQRLADTEKRLQHVCRERDQLKKCLSSVQQKIPVVSRATGGDKPFVNNDLKRLNELENVILQKNEEIEILLKEGHKLSADQLKTNNLLKKLRSEQKEYKQTESSHLKQIEQLTDEVQRLRNSLDNKDEILGTQFANSTRQMKLINSLEEQQEILKIQISKNEIKLSDQAQELDNLINENAELKEQLNQIHRNSKAEGQCIKDLDKAKSECEILKQKLDSHSRDFNTFKMQHEEQAAKWREEILYYQGLLSDAQLKIDLSNETITNATQPIMKQLEIVQSNLNSCSVEWETKENQLNKLLADYKLTASNAQSSEETWRNQLQTTEENLTASKLEVNFLKQKCVDLEKALTVEREKSQNNMFDLQELTVKLKTSKSEANEFRSRVNELEQTLLLEENRFKSLETLNNKLSMQLEEMKIANDDQSVQNKVMDHFNSHSDRKSSLNNSEPSSSLTSPKILKLPSDIINQASMEYIQSQLQLREGECAHLKREIEQLTTTQEKLLSEVAKQTARAEMYEKLAGVKYTKNVNNTISQSSNSSVFIKNNYTDGDNDKYNDANDPTVELQQRYETLLVLCGRLIEENNELKLDLADIKEMYRAQIDMLLKGQ
ncbi:TATA element modulatory factor [Schistosoma japonicum]|uniref:TATA element modulatory factor n=1 Tax=Schistosoma japonicum TaxID=6182 RepID=A0A4Z2CV83_SCHJA|nr:TATA element modulatory factor [Schistosoma japonicum]